MIQFDKPQEKNKDASNFETLIAKDLAAIEALHKQIVEKMMKEEILALPNLGKLEGIYDAQFNFLGLSGLKERYGDKWPIISETLKEYLNKEGGKRLRPLLLLNGYRTFSREKEPDQKIFGAAVGLELLHETALFLDDIIDNSTLRRGAPSLWKKIDDVPELNSFNASGVTADAGSLCFAYARHLMVDEVDEKTKPEVDKVFWQTVNDMKRGEEDDSQSAVTNEWPPIEHILEQFYLKTSSYSMRLPLLSALHASGATIDDNILKGIEDFSRGFGIAFQLHDDMLITKTSEEIGKDSNTDAINGTKIPVVILARQLGNEQEKKFIDKVWGKPDELTRRNLSKLKEIFKTTGALQKISEMIKLEIQKSESGLDALSQAGFDVSSLRYLLSAGLPWMDDLAKRVDIGS